MNPEGVVGASRAAPPGAPFTVRVPAEPVVLAELRAAVSAWLQRLQWPDEECIGIVHAVNEACTNVVEHAYAFDGAGELELTCREHDEDLRRHVVITVEDQGGWRPQSTPETTTRGLTMMRAFMHRVNVHARPHGTQVSMVSCAVPHVADPGRATRDPREEATPRPATTPTDGHERYAHIVARAELALQRAAALCDRAQVLIDSAQVVVAAGRARR